MSIENLWLICHKHEFDNWLLTKNIVDMLRKHGITTKQAAADLGISVDRTRNWFYRNTGMLALDLLRMMQVYHFVHQAVENSLLSEDHESTEVIEPRE